MAGFDEALPFKGRVGVGMGCSGWVDIMKGQTNPSILKPRLQRRLRSDATDAERLLWQRLRGRQLDDCKFRRQHPFGDYILDFVCLERMVVVELDGSQHAGQDEADADAVRTSFLVNSGFVVLRFWNNQVFEDLDGVAESIWQALQPREQPIPTPALPLKGRE